MSKDIPDGCGVVYNTSLDNVTAQLLLWSPVEHVLFTFGLPVVFAIGFASNAAFLYVLFRVTAMHTITNAYLGNIAAADLMFVTYSGGAYLSTYFLTPVRNDAYFINTPLGCGFSYGFSYFGYFASVMLITIVTAERYFGICRPFQHRAIAGKTHTLQMIAFSWVTAIVLSAISLPSWTGIIKQCHIWPDAEEYRDYPVVTWRCNSKSEAVYTFGEVVLAAPFFIVLPINLFMYGRIIRTLSTRTDAFDDKQQNEVATRARNQIARLLIVNGSVFLLYQTPYRILSIHYVARFFGHPFLVQPFFAIFLLASRLFVLINSCVNPFIYYCTSSVYRDAFREAFCFTQSPKPRGAASTSNISGKTKHTVVA